MSLRARFRRPCGTKILESLLGFVRVSGVQDEEEIMFRKLSVALLCALLVGGCGIGDLMAKKKKKKQAETQAASVNPRVKFETTQGEFTAEIFSDVPVTSKNFVDLVSSGFYDGLIFHRYVAGFVIQGGDPTGTGGGGSGKNIPRSE